MATYQDVFARYEKKYKLTLSQYAALRRWLQDRMEVDSYGLHTICNIYYDTPDFQLIRTSLEKPVYKEKLRLRSYGVPGGDTPVFVELKKKLDGVVYKRRVSLPLREAKRYLAYEGRPDLDCQILREIDWALARYPLEPKAFIAYDRIALFGREDPDLRITFDCNLRWRDALLDLSQGDWGQPLLDKQEILMEAKLPAAMPLWLSHVLDRLQIRQTSFSKYGACYQQNLFPALLSTGGICVA